MARMYNFGFMEFDHMLERLEKIPDSTKNEMMEAAAEEYKKHTEKTAHTMLRGDYFTGATGDNIVTKKQGNAMYVTWDRKVRHAKGVTFADVAFLNEYGAPGRGIPARPFIAQATKNGLLDAYEAALDELEKIL